jgi:hypothetical protein
MIDVEFEKLTAERYLKALQNSQPIEPPAEGWSVDTMIVLAGACAIMSECFSGKANVSEHIERLEADEEQARNDVAAAIQYAVNMSGAIIEGDYDNKFQPTMLCRVHVDGDGNTIVKCL